jgi:hypothetical protein
MEHHSLVRLLTPIKVLVLAYAIFSIGACPQPTASITAVAFVTPVNCFHGGCTDRTVKVMGKGFAPFHIIQIQYAGVPNTGAPII